MFLTTCPVQLRGRAVNFALTTCSKRFEFKSAEQAWQARMVMLKPSQNAYGIQVPFVAEKQVSSFHRTKLPLRLLSSSGLSYTLHNPTISKTSATILSNLSFPLVLLVYINRQTASSIKKFTFDYSGCPLDCYQQRNVEVTMMPFLLRTLFLIALAALIVLICTGVSLKYIGMASSASCSVRKMELPPNTTMIVKEEKQQQKQPIRQHPIVQAMLDPIYEVSSTGYRHVRVLERCHINKVASSASERMHTAWNDLLPISSNNATDNVLLADTFRFAIIRDPLSRLYSGYWNKCLHQIQHERHQCPNFFYAHKTPPTFLQFLQGNQDINNVFWKSNPHFRSMSSQCNIGRNDIVLYLEDPGVNQKLSKLWKALGVPHDVVDKEYPPNSRPIDQWSYYSNASNDTQQYYNCETLALALPLLAEDYEGPYKEWFPMPQWATDMKQQCQNSNQWNGR